MKESFNFLGFEISWYGLIIGIAFILAVVISSDLAKHRGLSKELPFDVVWIIFPLAIIGARFFYVINSLHEFSSVIDYFDVREGIRGLSIFGGIIGGLIGLIIYTSYKKINLLSAMDIFAPVLIFGQAIGRWGNFINQEVYGFEIKNKIFQWFPIGVNIDGTWHLATFFYESVLNLVGFVVLINILRRSEKKGIVAFTYFVWYGIVRLVLESLRIQKFILYIPGTKIQASSLISFAMILAGVAGLVWIKFKEKRNAENLK